jgi:isochorismate synthase
MQINKYGIAQKKNRLNLMNIFDTLKIQIERDLPFVIYKKPNEIWLKGIFQNSKELFIIDNFNEKGFAFCSFDSKNNIIIPENKSEIIIEKYIFNENDIKNNSLEINNQDSKINFEHIVGNAVDAITKNKFQKVVLSRKINLKLFDFELIKVFKNIISNYESAFCYCFYHPETGLWMGATPEQLLQVSDNKFETVALAGTQKSSNLKKTIWKEKEKQEQKFVTDYITKKLKSQVEDIEVSVPFTVKAGELLHIKTIISGSLYNSFNLKNIITILHPTPAVCGLPEDISKDYILKNENYNREFYTGFLGELNIENKTDLFVNLRCMKIENNEATIFVGCGITKKSSPEREWQETVNKSYTMIKCL